MTKKKLEIIGIIPVKAKSERVKDKNLRIFFNSSESMKTLGLMMPIFNIGKKMHMNHNMDHSNHN